MTPTRFCGLSSDESTCSTAGCGRSTASYRSEAKRSVNTSRKFRSNINYEYCPSWIVNDRKGKDQRNPRGAIQMTLLEG
ncbi:hypothetical protein BLNAU_23913 [Blattamonas nauphoetae]|uniref:Uncharacterized protein n=1 Tax=Blattamonas nauphoetae TaxID=2049346 RepID=A0ABQ9WNW7_9EUKA|nr:hypothetical protein BLNAU_23913 [Blattamonas nauphoetae]